MHFLAALRSSAAVPAGRGGRGPACRNDRKPRQAKGRAAGQRLSWPTRKAVWCKTTDLPSDPGSVPRVFNRNVASLQLVERVIVPGICVGVALFVDRESTAYQWWRNENERFNRFAVRDRRVAVGWFSDGFSVIQP